MLDTNIVNFPALLKRLEVYGDQPLLAMGDVTISSLTVGPADGAPCETCPVHPEHSRLCREITATGATGFRGCLGLASRCCPVEEPACENLYTCMWNAALQGKQAFDYFGTGSSPRWFKGGAWVLGHDILEFIAINGPDLKIRGVADMLVGFWIVALEDVLYVDIAGEHCTLAFEESGCYDDCFSSSILVSGMTGKKWLAWYQPEACQVKCTTHLWEGFRKNGRSLPRETNKCLRIAVTGASHHPCDKLEAVQPKWAHSGHVELQ
eukprot:821057-Amphidinium_carterae.1